MASVRLSVRDCEDDYLPDVCAVCGAPAELRKRKQFSYLPSWVYVLILAGLLVFVIIALVLTKRRTVGVPLCERHRHYWLRRQLWLWGSLAALGALCAGAFALAGALQDPPNDGLGFVCGGSLVALLAWFIAAAVVQQKTIRADLIDDRTIKLVSVARAFADAYEDERADRRGWADRAAADHWEGRPRRGWEDEDRIREEEDDRDRPPGGYRRG